MNLLRKNGAGDGAITDKTEIKLTIRQQFGIIAFVLALAFSGFGWWSSVNVGINDCRAANERQDGELKIQQAAQRKIEDDLAFIKGGIAEIHKYLIKEERHVLPRRPPR